MTLIEKYGTYRQISMELNPKIMDTCLDHDVLMKSARLLGIVHSGTLIFDSEDETNVLMDFALNEYRVNRLLLFIRLVPFKDFNMTSGVSFVFPEDLKENLLRRYKKLSKKVESDSDSIKRFVSFFRLNKIGGMEVRYE
jgi:hypothetical protein